MATISQAGNRAALQAQGTLPRDIPDAVRIVITSAALVAMWNYRWFVDLTDRNLLAASSDGSLSTQIIFVTLGATMGTAIWWLGLGRLRPLACRPILIFVCWFALTILTSVEPLLSIRRVILLTLATIAVMGVLVVPRSATHFALALLISTGVVLGASYFGIVFLPQYAVHNAFDVDADPIHAGLWRGIFDGKNAAGAAMMLIIFAGLYIASAFNRAAGWAVIAASIVFLIGSHSKTALATLPFVLGMTAVAAQVRSPTLRALILLTPAASLLLVSLGSILFAPVGALVHAVLPDATFTGRTEIWKFAIDSIEARPLFGWGYGAFWGTPRTLYASATNSWAPAAAHAHNAYLDAAINSGLPGLALLLMVYVWLPLRDLQTISKAEGRVDPLSMLFLRIWTYALLSACLESVFQNPYNATTFMMLMAILGLRLRANYRPAG